MIQPAEPLPTSPVVERRFARGRRFETAVIALLQQSFPEATLIAESNPKAREESTLWAMRQRAELIIGGRLPTDLQGRRVGEPDLLVRSFAGIGYRAVDIKNHQTLTTGDGLSAVCSQLNMPYWEYSVEDEDGNARQTKG